MKQIVCVGDSNTRGYDPRSWCGEEYDHPWPEILAELTGCEVVNLGENGRELPRSENRMRQIDDVLRRRISGDSRILLMLGTNDILNGSVPTAEAFGERLGQYVLHLKNEFPEAETVILSPILSGRAGCRSSCREVAEELSCPFLDVDSWDLPLAFDGVHLTEEGHRLLAEKLCRSLISPQKM